MVSTIDKKYKEMYSTGSNPANISMLFQGCRLVDTTSRRETTSNQR